MAIRRHRALLAVAAGSLVLAACSSTASSGGSGHGSAPSGSTSTTEGQYGSLPAESGTPIKGGTVSYPIIAGAQPTYIMPVFPGSAWTAVNYQFQILLYRPLYLEDIGNRPVINYPLSLATPPVYSNGNKTVTINMSHNYKWSDGHPVDAQDVLFFIDEVRAAVKENAQNFGPYTTGDFPDNIVSAKAPSTYQVVLTLNKGYNPSWFTDTQLTYLTPMPSTAWNTASAGGSHLDFSNPTNAKKIFNYLNTQSKKLSTYGTNPLWKDVDGPFTLTSFTPTTDANTMVPNPTYGGPQKARFSVLKAEYFASSTAEFNAILAGKLSQGFVAAEDLPQVPKIKAQGYNVYGYPDLGFEYAVFNFKDTTDHWDKVIAQPYIRQALAHLSDQTAIIHGAYGGAAAPAYGPIPAIPQTPYVPSNAATNPYPYSISAASQLLSSHGWKVVPGGVSTCQSPGTAANQCGAGIPQGQTIKFTDYYVNDPPSAGQETTQWASAASQVGIKITPTAKTFNFIVDQYDDPVAPQNNNKWQAENYGGFTENPYPTTDTIFNTGGSGNEGDYSSPEADKLIKASKFSSDPNAVKDEAAFITKDLPAVFLPNPDLIFAWKGISGTPDSFANLTQYSFTPEYWYLTSK
ncbi:MAG TPA: ABC transporter substrate-binding protein [Mycobacteriales bacterium]|nr:ABC transporter substrate-binding protein [Mycobacteriales bacterium]